MIVLLFPRRTPISSLNYSFDESLGVQVARVDRLEKGEKKKEKKKEKVKKKRKKERPIDNRFLLVRICGFFDFNLSRLILYKSRTVFSIYKVKVNVRVKKEIKHRNKKKNTIDRDPFKTGRRS